MSDADEIQQTNLQQLIDIELLRWKEIGVDDPSSVLDTNHFLETVKASALVKLLIDKGLVTREELQEAYEVKMLEYLRNAREGYVEARRAALGGPKLLIPRGVKH